MRTSLLLGILLRSINVGRVGEWYTVSTLPVQSGSLVDTMTREIKTFLVLIFI